MMRLPRAVCTLVVGAVPVIATSFTACQAFGQETPAPVATTDDDAGKSLQLAVENFWHYAKVARYDLAKEEATKILAVKENPSAILDAFEKVVSDRTGDNLDVWMIRWQGVPEVADVVGQLTGVLEEGRRARRADPAYIKTNIERLANGERAYLLAIGRLRDSGELAVQMMVDYLRDPDKTSYQPHVIRALRDMGRISLSPLLAATEMKDPATLTLIERVLGDIGYEASIPYLVKLANDPNGDAGVRDAAVKALAKMGVSDPSKLNAAQLFYELGDKLYYNTASIVADPRNPVAFVWFWDDQKGLLHKDVPPAIFSQVMSMRAAEYVLQLDPANEPAVSLWIAANFKREANMPAGGVDTTRAPKQPAAHYYAVASGVKYCNQVLYRSLNDKDSAVALRSILALKEIAGQSNLFPTGDVQPIVTALRYPNRLVRIEAAMTIAASLPQATFSGQERVVPILAEAVAQNGKPSILVILPSQDTVNATIKALRDAGYAADGATSVDGALSEGIKLPSVDLILVNESLGASEMDHLTTLVSQNPRLEGAVRLVITASTASPYAAATINNPQISIAPNLAPDTTKDSVDKALARAGGLVIDEKKATELALEATQLLGNLAISRGQVLEVANAEPQLLVALADPRPELVKAAAKVLGLINTPTAQLGLSASAADGKLSVDVRVSLYKSLATNAKFFGNHLDASQIKLLGEVVETADNLEVRSAAAEARGALNLPADEARALIVNQSRK